MRHDMRTRLSRKSVNSIAAILDDAWGVPTSVKAAHNLRSSGFTSHDVWLFGKTKVAQRQPDEWRNNTYNDLYDMEVTKKKA